MERIVTSTRVSHKLEFMKPKSQELDLSTLKRGLDGENYGKWLDFHALLVDTREELGLTQQQVADRLGVTQPAVSVFEDGSTGIRIQSILNYASALGLELQLSLKPVEKDSQPS
jgi:DNA-binding XRE family transcriptional regulator